MPWSSVNKASDIILSESDMVAASNVASNGGTVLSVQSRTSGKWYFEIERTQTPSANGAGGVHNGTTDLSKYLGQDAYGWGQWPSTATVTLNDYHNGSVTSSGATTIRALIRVAIDLTAGKLWFSGAHPATWFDGGDPGAGTTATYTFTPGGTWYAAACPYAGHASTDASRIKMKLREGRDVLFDPPVGFMLWGADKSVSGVVIDKAGAPAARVVVVTDRATKRFLGSTVSSAVDGTYAVQIPGTGEVNVAFMDDDAGDLLNDIIERVIPG